MSSIVNEQILQRYARPTPFTTTVKDVNAPYSYQIWVKINQGIIPGQEFKQYNDYLINWYKDKNNENLNEKNNLRLNYLTLLGQLQVFFADQETENWYTSIDLNNEKEILAAIPYFARKLRDISLYYLNLRTRIKQAQVKYKQTGTRTGVITQVTNNTLNKYTKYNRPVTVTNLPAILSNNAPFLTAINDTIGLEIKELYDTNSYFDRSITLPNSAYFDQTNISTFLPILTHKGLDTSSIDWIYDLGTFELSGSPDEETFNYNDFIQLSKSLSEKYLGSEKYSTNQTPVSTQVDSYSISIVRGDNVFYWPTGAYKPYADQYKTYIPTPLSATELITLGTGGSSLDIADTIFVKSRRGIEGAWLYKPAYLRQNKTMFAFFEADAETEFRFPFPGFGLSAERGLWSGYGLSSDPRFFYLKDNVQQEIYRKYWTQAFGITGTTPININSTTLANSKAWASKTYQTADKIKVWLNPPSYDSPTFKDAEGQQINAWLYRFDTTDISIKKDGNTTLLWPYQAIENENPRPFYEENLSKVCAPLSLSAINFTYAIAGNGLSSADVIYKISNIFGTTVDATECCWLSGRTINDPINKTIYTTQNSFQGLFTAGEFNHFIWTGPDYTNVNTVFKTVQHRPDCKFVTTPNTTYKDYNLCTCHQTHFVPFGHPGESYNDYEGHSDFIIEDTFYPNKLDITSWRDITNTAYFQSSAFFWYKTNNVMGFGEGDWVAGGNIKDPACYLRTGERYFYYRSNARSQDLGEETNNYPSYAVRYDYGDLYTQNYNTDYVWIKAQQLPDNTWYSTDQRSDMVLYPGDLLIYSRRPQDTFLVSGTANTPVQIRENRGSIWSNWDYISVPVSTSLVDTNRSMVSLNYPSPQVVSTAPASQKPVQSLNDSVVNATWTVTGPNGFTYRAPNTTSTFFTPLSPGVYAVSLRIVWSTVGLPVRLSSTNTGTYFYVNTAEAFFNGIPSITAIPATTNITVVTASNTKVPGYVLNTNLQGWDYSRSVPSTVVRNLDAGAKPFWAKAYNTKDAKTYYKGIDVWGQPYRFFDTHNIVTQPEPSNITLSAGIKLRYERNYNTNLEWYQPVEILYENLDSQWHELSFTTDTPSNLAEFVNNLKTDFIVTPTQTVSKIVLENYIENEPVEIIYNSLNNFTWNFATQTIIPILIKGQLSATLALEPLEPWTNLSNLNFPTVNFLPSFNNLKTQSELGGFFVPNKLGASVFADPETTNTFNTTSVFESLFDIAGNRRGLSKQDQATPFLTNSNSIWLKEKSFSNSNAGTIDKNVFKKYQKFYPYQSSYETNNRTQIGMIDPSSRLSPWNGPEDTTWNDKNNYPVSYTGELNLQKWLDDQRLKQSDLIADNWVTDIFGNQYALYKDIKNVKAKNRENIYGELWVRKNSQEIGPASKQLLNIFDTYLNTTLYDQLIGSGIKKIDMFFDTLFIQTSGVLIFETINYDYIKNNIFSLTDDARYISLAAPTTLNLNREFLGSRAGIPVTYAQPGDTWFLPEEKKVLISLCTYFDYSVEPELYEYDINTKILLKIFPLKEEDLNTLRNLFNTLLVEKINPPKLSYNQTTKQILMAFTCRDFTGNNLLIEFSLKYLSDILLEDILVYTVNSYFGIDTPPAVVANLNRRLEIPNPRGRIYRLKRDNLRAGTTILLEDINTGELLIYPVTTYNGLTSYPLSTFDISAFNDTLLTQPLSSNYIFYDFNTSYIQKYGFDTIVTVEPLSFLCVPVLNPPVTFAPIDLPLWVNLTPKGEFTGIPPAIEASYTGTFKVTNTVGSTFYNLNIDVR